MSHTRRNHNNQQHYAKQYMAGSPTRTSQLTRSERYHRRTFSREDAANTLITLAHHPVHRMRRPQVI